MLYKTRSAETNCASIAASTNERLAKDYESAILGINNFFWRMESVYSIGYPGVVSVIALTRSIRRTISWSSSFKRMVMLSRIGSSLPTKVENTPPVHQ